MLLLRRVGLFALVRAVVLGRLAHNPDRAERTAGRYLRIRSRDPRAWMLVDFVHRRTGLDLAERELHLRKGLKHTGDVVLAAGLARVLAEERRFSDAREVLTAFRYADDDRRSRTVIHTVLGMLAWAEGAREEARTHALSAASVWRANDHEVEHSMELFLCLQLCGETEQARFVVENLVRAKPINADPLCHLPSC